MPDAYPDFLQWLPGSERIIRYDKHAADKADALFKEAELIFCLDFNGTDRVDEMRDALEQSPASKIMIDHHLDPRMDTVLTVSFPHISASVSKAWTVAIAGMFAPSASRRYSALMFSVF